jgi:Domain of unknown function (DUF4389)
MSSDQGPRWASRGVTEDEWLPALDIPEPERQRRLTVALRLLLLIPHGVVLVVLFVAAFFVMVAGWFAALILGRLPGPVFRFLEGYLRYFTRVSASAKLLVDRYPPFTLGAAEGYPVRIALRAEHLNRLAIFFRLILLIPAAILEGIATAGWWVLGILWWLITLIAGRMPRPLFEATAAVQRYEMRFYAYAMMLTPAYPKGFFGDQPDGSAPREAASATRPLRVSSMGKAVLVLCLLAGIADTFVGSSSGTDSGMRADPAAHTSAPLPAVAPPAG